MSLALVRYDAACKALAAARTIDEIKHVRNGAEALRAYAKQAKNKQLEMDATEIRIRAERRVGELMASQRQSVGLAKGGQPYQATGSKTDPVESVPTLAEAGVDKHLADRARKLAAMPDRKFEQVVEHWRDRTMTETVKVNIDVLASTTHVSQNTGEHEWYTPEPYIKAARQVLGAIDLDPASSAVANKVVGAKAFCSLADDGLTQEWRGNVWMNPPYAQPVIAQFCAKLIYSLLTKTVPAAIVLVNNATETVWFTDLAGIANAVCFPTSRVKFWSPGKDSTTPLQGQAVLYIGPKVATFVAAFSHLGIVWVKP